MTFMHARLLAGLVLAAACAGCTNVNPYYDPSKPHHAREGFRNNYLEGSIGGSFLRWQWERWRDGLPKPPANGYAFAFERPDVDWLKQNRSEATATWIGHATVLLQVGGLNILTDPIFSERASPFSWIGPKRKTPPAMRIDELPRIDVVIVSHNHYDHLDLPTLRALDKQAGGPPLYLMPLGVGDWLRREGIGNVQQLDWWQSHPVGDVRFHFTPVQHWSARGLFDRFATLWGGWVIEAQAEGKPFKTFFTGDTGYSKDFADIHRRFGDFDFAMIPIGAYEPRWFMKPQHVNPEEAVQIHRDLHSRRSLGIHWGAFELTDEALDEPPAALASALRTQDLDENVFVVINHGATLKITKDIR